MAEFCFVVTRFEWDENPETGACWEDRDICRVFRNYEDARRFVEKNSADVDLPMRWHGDRVYSGKSSFVANTVEGLRYEIHYVGLD